MIFPSQEIEIKNFLDDLLKEYRHARKKIYLDCDDLVWLMERAKNLRTKLDLWTIIPEEEAVRAGN